MQKGVKLLIVLALVLAGATLAYAGAAPQGYANVTDAYAAPDGKDLDLKGSIVEGSLDRTASPITFVVEDGANTLLVQWDPALPLPDGEAGGSIEGKNVVLHGSMHDGVFVAHGMIVGCASKYRAA